MCRYKMISLLPFDRFDPRESQKYCLFLGLSVQLLLLNEVTTWQHFLMFVWSCVVQDYLIRVFVACWWWLVVFR